MDPIKALELVGFAEVGTVQDALEEAETVECEGDESPSKVLQGAVTGRTCGWTKLILIVL